MMVELALNAHIRLPNILLSFFNDEYKSRLSLLYIKLSHIIEFKRFRLYKYEKAMNKFTPVHALI